MISFDWDFFHVDFRFRRELRGDVGCQETKNFDNIPKKLSFALCLGSIWWEEVH